MIRGLLLLVRRSLRQHLVSTVLTAFTIAMAAGLVMCVFSIRQQAYEAFTVQRLGFDAVLGARGSPLQLVMNAVYHLETSPGNIPWTLYKTMKESPSVAEAIPYALGDNYLGYRIVGTMPELFREHKFEDGGKLDVEEGGRVFDARRREATIGSFAAARTKLKVGDTFSPFHGLEFDPTHQHAEVYTVVGILKPTNTPIDRVIFVPIEGIFRMTGHVLRGTGEEYTPEAGKAIPDESREVSVVLLKFRDPQAGFQLNQRINRQGKVATLAWPIGSVMAELFQKIGWLDRVLQVVAYMVVVVAGASIAAAMYNSINERKRDIAIMRSLGARRGTVFGAIILESASIAAIGSVAGYVVYGAVLCVAAMIIRERTGVVLDIFFPHPVLALTPFGMIAVGALAGILPAIKAYATDVAGNLSPIS